MNNAVMFSKASDEWSTPQDLFDDLNKEFHFMLDAAATEQNAKCPFYITKENNALIRSWGGFCPVWPYESAVWLNPPYSMCREFMAKATAEACDGKTVVCLVPSRTDTRWWHDYVWNSVHHHTRLGVEIRFIKGRLKFGGATTGAPFPSAIVIFRSYDR